MIPPRSKAESLIAFKYNWIISNAAIEVDDAKYGAAKNYSCFNHLKETLTSHYELSKSKNRLEYGGQSEQEIITALVFDVIPKTFNITSKNCKKYNLEDYLAGLGLVLEQFEDIEHAGKEKRNFVRDFIVDLGNKRLSRLEGSPSLRRYPCFAA